MKIRKNRLSTAMLAMLKNASAGLPLKNGLHSKSEHGGAEWTIVALRKRGYIMGGEITAEGVSALVARAGEIKHAKRGK